MSDTDHLAFLRDPRLADLAASPLPAWLWSIDAERILWANAAGAALFGTTTVMALQQRRFERKHAAAQQVARLAAALPASGARLQRLRGFAPGVGRLLTCNCARIDLADGTAILVAATEPAGPSLARADRIGRLLDGIDGPFAVFAADGSLLLAAPELRDTLGRRASLAAAGAAELAARALSAGRAEGETADGLITLERIGTGATQLLLATLASLPQPAETPAPAPARQDGADQAEMVRTDAAAAPLAPDLPERGTPPAQEPPAPAGPAPDRRQPLRVVWQIDAEDRLTVATDDFLAMIGPGVAARLARPWREVADELGLDPEGRLAHALASRDTFSGIIVSWPIEGTAERLAAELSGLPMFDRDRSFRGFRGFGICRDVARLAAIAAARRSPFVEPRDVAAGQKPTADAPAPDRAREDAAAPPDPPAQAPLPDDGAADAAAAPTPDLPPPPAGIPEGGAAPAERPQLSVVPAAKNVVPFRPALPLAPDKRPTLSPVETNAFREIAKALGARVEGEQPDASPAKTDAADTEAADAAETDSSAAPEHTAAEQPPAPPARSFPRPIPSAYAAGAESATLRAPSPANGERAVLDRLPVGVLICRGETLLHANRALLEWTGYEDIDAI